MIPPWVKRCDATSPSSFHELAPYIGRLPPKIARALVLEYTARTSLIVDPFCGSGALALEVAILGRTVFACDWNPYAVELARAKLGAPPTLQMALAKLSALYWQLVLEHRVVVAPTGSKMQAVGCYL